MQLYLGVGGVEPSIFRRVADFHIRAENPQDMGTVKALGGDEITQEEYLVPEEGNGPRDNLGRLWCLQGVSGRESYTAH